MSTTTWPHESAQRRATLTGALCLLASAVVVASPACRTGFEQDPSFTQDVGDTSSDVSLDGRVDSSGDVRPDNGSDGDAATDGTQTDTALPYGVCGNGIIEPPSTGGPGTPRSPGDAALPALPDEQCDDGQFPPKSGDGCDDFCQLEAGWWCPSANEACKPVCGDGQTLGSEACDVGNQLGSSGCAADCSAVTVGWSCLYDSAVGHSVCFATECGDGFIAGEETCDPGPEVVDSNCNNCQLVACAPEVCDGVDNDCDGEIDEGIVVACKGPGGCSDGYQYCVDNALTPCLGAEPPVELCGDGVDNDCNGVTDESTANELPCGSLFCDDITTDLCPPPGSAVETCAAVAAGEEVCGDGKDNDCDGVVDEGCDDACIWVREDHNGEMTGAKVTPFATIQAGIEAAAAAGKQVCVMCGENGVTSYKDGIVMVPGVDVIGGFHSSGAGFCVTEIKVNDGVGVHFPPDVGTTKTTLKSMKIVREFGEADAVLPSATVAIQAPGAQLVDVWVRAPQFSSFSVGVAVSGFNDDGTSTDGPLITGGRIDGGANSEKVAGVYAAQVPVRVQQMCGANVASAACNQRCVAGDGDGIRMEGTVVQGADPEVSFATGILLDGAAGSLVDQVSSCALGGINAAGMVGRGDLTGVRVMRSNLHGGSADVLGSGAVFNNCNGTQPRVAFNSKISGGGSEFSFGLSASDGCHVLVDHNDAIVGAETPVAGTDNGIAVAGAVGVRCTRSDAEGFNFSSDGQRSDCVIHDNTIAGSSGPVAGTAAGVICAGSCSLVKGNVIAASAGTANDLATGVSLIGQSDALVDANRIFGSCGASASVGVRADGARARLTNNLINGGPLGNNACAGTTSSTFYGGVLIHNTDNGHGLDVHSNLITPATLGVSGGACSSYGVAFAKPDNPDPFFTSPQGPQGTLRNNIVAAGPCETHAAVATLNKQHFPETVENNLLLTPLVAYLSAEGEAFATASEIDGLGAGVSGTLVHPLVSLEFADLFGDGAVVATLGLVDGGVNTAAPATDFNGDARPHNETCDIGPFESGAAGFVTVGVAPPAQIPTPGN